MVGFKLGDKMLKTIAQLEMNIEGRIIHLMCDNDCPLSHIKEALFQFQKYIGKIEDTAKAQQEQAVLEEQNPEESFEAISQEQTTEV